MNENDKHPNGGGMHNPEAAEAPAGRQTAGQAEAGVADEWALAMAEQSADSDNAAPESSQSGAEAAAQGSKGDEVFQPLDSPDQTTSNTRDLETILDIPVRLNVELGRTRLTIKQLLELTEGSIVELDGLAGDPMDIMINGHLVAQGEVVVVDDKYGIRITDIITASERAQKLNR